MHIYYSPIYLTSDSNANADRIYAIIYEHDPERFTHTTGTNIIRVEDTFDVAFGYASARLTVDGRVTPVRWDSYSSFNGSVLLLISDTVFYFLIRDTSAVNNPIGGFCWIKNRGVNYLGVSVNDTGTNGQLDGMTFTNKSVTPTNPYYTIKKHAQFELRDQNIIYINTSVIADNSGNFDTLEGLCSCSTVAFGTMVGVNHRNYYAIGSNTLILDDQEDEGDD